ncbi:MAG: sigma-70 family RNA polymerase sigma factor [Planctomycetes bacterium]|nr:sigma-70 family RNA polymerase sigma factor [Planctomycetota bacterium]
MEATGQLQDEVLVERSKAGDRDAFSELVLKYQEQVLNLAYRRVGDRDMALDIAQDSFLKAYKGLQKFEGKSQFFTWLYRITLNEAATALRKASRRPNASLSARDSDHGGIEPAAEGYDPQAALQSQDEQALVQQALAQVDEEFAGAVILRDIEGLSYQEISQVLDLPLGSVKSKIHRGRLALKNTLSKVMERQ